MSFRQKAAVFTFVALSAFSSLHAQKSLSSAKPITSPKPLVENICKEKTEAKLVEFGSLKDKPLITFLENHCIVQYRAFFIDRIDSLNAWGFKRHFIEFAPKSWQNGINRFMQTGEMTYEVEKIQELSAGFEQMLNTAADGSFYPKMFSKLAKFGWQARAILYQYDVFTNQFPVDSATQRYAFVTDSSIKADGIKSTQLVGRYHPNSNAAQVFMYHVSLEQDSERQRQAKHCYMPNQIDAYLKEFSSTHGNGLWEVAPNKYVLIMGKEQ